MKKETLMTPEQFVYWLQGHFEINPDVNTLTEKQIEMIRTHLNYVFTHVGTLVQQEPHGLGVKELKDSSTLDSMSELLRKNPGLLTSLDVQIC